MCNFVRALSADRGLRKECALRIPSAPRELAQMRVSGNARVTLRQKTNLYIFGKSMFSWMLPTYNVLRPLDSKENNWEWLACDCSSGEPMCEQLWLEFASTEVGLKFKDAFEDAEVLQQCRAGDHVKLRSLPDQENPLNVLDTALVNRGDDDRLDGHSAPRTHRGTVRCGANVEASTEKFHLVCLLVARSPAKLLCCRESLCSKAGAWTGP